MSVETQFSLGLYRKLRLMRRSEEYIVKHYPENDMKTPMHMSMGQEAIPAGVCYALDQADPVFASYRSHAAFLAKTEDTNAFFGELYGRVTGTGQGRSGSMHLADPTKGHMCSSGVVASMIPVAVGAAFANRQRKNGRVSAVFFGDGAMDEGNFWESLNVACVMELPVLFVCEDNGFAVHTPIHHRQGYRSITEVLKNFYIEAFQSDSTDAEEICRLTKEALRIIREKGTPAFLHLKCCRYLETVGIYEDFHVGYRSKEECDAWRARDTVKLQRKRLEDLGVANEEIGRLEQSIDAQIEASIKAAQAAALPQPADLYRGVFYEGN